MIIRPSNFMVNTMMRLLKLKAKKNKENSNKNPNRL